MQRVTISLDDDLLEAIDRLSAARGYTSRSESIRDIVRDHIAKERTDLDPQSHCVATLAYVFEHEKRDLARRLTVDHHSHHDISVSTLHVHLDSHDCLEVNVMKGHVGEVREFADTITTQRGVRSSSLHIIPQNGHEP